MGYHPFLAGGSESRSRATARSLMLPASAIIGRHPCTRFADSWAVHRGRNKPTIARIEPLAVNPRGQHFFRVE